MAAAQSLRGAVQGSRMQSCRTQPAPPFLRLPRVSPPGARLWRVGRRNSGTWGEGINGLGVGGCKLSKKVGTKVSSYPYF